MLEECRKYAAIAVGQKSVIRNKAKETAYARGAEAFILEQASFGKYKIQPVIRHGRQVEFHKVKELAERAIELIKAIQTRNYDTVAVICRNEEEAETAKRQLREQLEIEGKEEESFRKGVMVLPIRLTKGLEFDAVILWNPDKAAYQEKEGDAKLLYVAVTRALHELHIVYKNELSGLFMQ